MEPVKLPAHGGNQAHMDMQTFTHVITMITPDYTPWLPVSHKKDPFVLCWHILTFAPARLSNIQDIPVERVMASRSLKRPLLINRLDEG